MNLPPFQWSFTTVQVTGSSVGEAPFSAVLMGGTTPMPNEAMRNADAFGAPGIVFRPRPPSDVTGTDGQSRKVSAEAIAVRSGGELIPFTWRDLRFNKVYPAPKDGTIALVGYGGAFLSFDDTDELESLTTLYVPYAGGTKCHCIVLDPKQESVAIVQGDGLALGMTKDGGIVARADGSTTWTLKPGLFQVIASKIVLQGNVVAGANPAGAVPAALSTLSPSPSVFLSLV